MLILMDAPAGPNRRFLRRPGLLGTFSVLSIITLAVLGVALWQILDRQLHEGASDEAGRAANLILHTVLEHHLPAESLAAGRLAPETIAELDEVVEEGNFSGSLDGVKVWTPDGLLVYGPEGVRGRRFPLSDEVRAALAGTASDTRESGTDQRLGSATRAGHAIVVSYLPITGHDGGAPYGAVEIERLYGPYAAMIADQQRVLALTLIGSLLVLYAVLLPIVAHASRRLRVQLDDTRHQALHDGLTGLPNRTLLHDRIGQALRADRRNERSTALLLLDLDRFKEINDTLGHGTGDLLLQRVSQRLLDRLRGSDTLARLGGDEFAVLLPDQDDPAGALRVADDLRASLVEPVSLNGITVAVDASVGVALAPMHGEDVETLIRRADVAMYAAKTARAGVALYDAEHDTYSPDHLTLIDDLRRAIADGGLRLSYQPKLDVTTCRVHGVEALSRWTHPTRGEISPETFIPIAEHTGLIRPLTAWVLDEALGQIARWREAGHDITVAINLSALTLLDHRLVEDVRDALERADVPAQALEIEITETAVMTDPRRAVEILGQIHALGVRIAIDDFGTGYSCLAHLKRLPIDDIKIDRSFVMGMVGDPENEAIVRSTIDLGRNLGLRVVAEGVETREALAELSHLGCHLAQGFLFSAPMSPDEIVPWLEGRALTHPPRPERDRAEA